jgi:small-conductance mechanosensitive channel
MSEFLPIIGLSNEKAISLLIAFAPNALSALGVMIMSIIFYLITARIFEAALGRTPMQPSLITITVRSLYRGIVFLISLIFVLGELGINVTAALAGVGVLGLAIGFAAQTTLANIFSGFGIFIDDLYRRGHWVRISDHYGEVVDISLRTTKIKTLDNTHISIPNSVITSSPVINYSEQGMLRITVKVVIGFDTPIEKARAALLQSVSEIKGVLKRPGPHVVVEKIGDCGVYLFVRIWVSEPGFEQKYYFLLTETCKIALDKANIKIPFPHRDIRIVEEKPVKKKK